MMPAARLPRRVLAKAIARKLPAGMNRLEESYAAELEAKRLVGQIREWRFNALKLELGRGAWVKIDFFVVAADGTMEMHETKGFQRESALVRLKVAARLYPFRFIQVKKAKGFFSTECFTDGELVGEEEEK